MRVMTLYGTWDTRKWEGAIVSDVVAEKLSEFDGGEIERLTQQVEYLSNVVAKLVDRTCNRDSEVLATLDVYKWSVSQ